MATDEPVAPLLLETDGQLDSGLVQDAGDMEVDDEVLQIGRGKCKLEPFFLMSKLI